MFFGKLLTGKESKARYSIVDSDIYDGLTDTDRSSDDARAIICRSRALNGNQNSYINIEMKD